MVNKILKEIRMIKPSTYYDEDTGVTRLYITYKNISYTGHAFLSKEDKEFASPRLGYHIAYTRAVLKILQTELKEIKKQYRYKKQFYEEVINNNREADPFYHFYMALLRTEFNIKKFQTAIKEMHKDLRIYIENIDKMKASVYKRRGQ